MTPLIKRLSEPKTVLYIGIIYTFLITVAFLSPATEIPQTNIPLADKLAHLLIYSLLSFNWLWFYYVYDKYHISVKVVFVILVVCFLYGLFIETLQHYFTESRTFDLYDIVANEVGCMIGLITFWSIKKRVI